MTSNKLTLFTFLMSLYFPGHKKDKKLIRLRAAPGTKKWILMSKICLSKSLDVADVTIFLKIFYNWRSNLSTDDMISAYNLKTCVQNDIFWCEIGNLVPRALFPQWLRRWGGKRAFSRSTSKAREKRPGDEVEKKGHDLENREAYLHQEFPGVPSWGLSAKDSKPNMAQDVTCVRYTGLIRPAKTIRRTQNLHSW